MKKRIAYLIIPLIILGFHSQYSFGQNRNLNPNANNPLWKVSYLRPLTSVDYAKIKATPELKLTEKQTRGTLPSKLDNSTNSFFPPIFSQIGGCCGQASGIEYNYTYSMNLARGTSAVVLNNRYPTHYTYNFLNDGTDSSGSWYFDGWNIIDANGCPDAATYPNSTTCNPRFWMNGYSNYYSGMKNRINDVATINVSNPTGLNTLKHWMFDHLNNEQNGGIANFSAGMLGFKAFKLPKLSSDSGAYVITAFGYPINHAMTFVGYDDSVKFDFNGDGKYTNDIDINGDGIVDMRDWEVGALIMANSWSTDWANGGKIYVMYKLLAESEQNGGIWNSMVHVIHGRKEYNPLLTVRASVTYPLRDKISISAGISEDTTSIAPEHSLDFPIFNYQGGNYFMQGGSSNLDKTIEFGLDITPLLSYISLKKQYKIFLKVASVDTNSLNKGLINNFSVIDYTHDSANETISKMNNVNINVNSNSYISLVKSILFDGVKIADSILSDSKVNFNYSKQLTAKGGVEPYKWNIVQNYIIKDTVASLPVTSDQMVLSGTDDDVMPVKLPFAFPFYSTIYDTIYVSTDGSIVFSNSFNYIRTDDGVKQQKCIAVFGADLVYIAAKGDYIKTASDTNSFTVEWKSSEFSDSTASLNFGIKLFKDGHFETFYKNIAAIDYTAGCSNGDGEQFAISSISHHTNLPLDKSQNYKNNSPIPSDLNITTSGILSLTPHSIDTIKFFVKAKDLNKIFTTKQIEIGPQKSSSSVENRLKDNLEVYPNPCSDVLNILIPNDVVGELSIELLSIDGKVNYLALDNKQNSNSEEVIKLNISDIPQGVYLCKVSSGNRVLICKIQKI